MFTHTYQPRIIDGYAFGSQLGHGGVGSDNARGAFDNIRVQVLPPQITLDRLEDFSDGVANGLTATPMAPGASQRRALQCYLVRGIERQSA